MGKASKESGSSGAPRWTYVAAAVVAAGGLAWTIASHFMSGPRPASPPPAPTTPAVSVTVGGTHNVAVGVMGGGVINQGVQAGGPASTDAAPRRP